MKKLLYIFLILILPLFLFSCKSNNIESLIVENSATESINMNEKYKPSEFVHIFAIYSDGSKVEKTNDCHFSLDTSSEGIKECIVTYLQFKVTYNVIIIDINKKTMYLDLSNVKVDYIVGDYLSLANLQVRILYASGKYEDITDFECGITDSKGNSFNPEYPFNKSGDYKVSIKYLDLVQSYDIRVMFYKSIAFDFNEIENERTLINGRYRFKTVYEGIITDDLVVFSLLGENTYYEKNNYLNQPINIECNGITFTNRFNISPADRGFKIQAKRSCELSIIADITNKEPILLYSTLQEITPITNPFESLTMYSFSLPEGTYFLRSSNENIFIYEMTFTFDSI